MGVEPSNQTKLEWIRVLGRVFYNELGSPTRMLGTATTITQQKNDEIMLFNSYRSLANADLFTQLSEMVAIYAHELTQPLTSILTYTSGCIQRLETNSEGTCFQFVLDPHTL